MNAERLADLRHERPKTRQADVAQMLGIGTSTYSMYEQGLREPDDETKVKIAHYFGVSVDYLVGNSDSRTAQPTRSLDAELLALQHQLRDNEATPTYHGKVLTATARQGIAALIDGVRKAADALVDLTDD
ncbi:helix-turn-helix domain-containing protein [Lacticaseibacillus sp. GG6-2]